MLQKSKTILFFGTEDFSAYTLQALIAHGYNVGAIITKPDTRRGRHKDLIKPRVKEIGEQHGIPVWQPTKLIDIIESVQKFDAPVGVLVSYGKIIPQAIIDLFTPGIINIHPSLLPLYRGPSPIETTVLQGDTVTGISIMQLTAGMDAGPIYLQESLPLNGKETVAELYKKFGTRGAELLVNILPAIIDGTIAATPQDSTRASYCQLIKKEDGVLDWNKPSEVIEREVRAYADWPQSRTVLGSLEVIITKVSVDSTTPLNNAQPGDITTSNTITAKPVLCIATSDGHIQVESLKPLGKKEMPVEAFLAGYASRLV